MKPGGYTVTVLKDNGKTYSYDKVKNPRAYISNMIKHDVLEIRVDDEVYWKPDGAL
jgi:hypothetical protein